MLIIIPARGGSKGIPRKNIRPFAGRPLIAWTIDAALAVAERERILLSTDDDEIAAVGRACGLDVEYMRPEALATDTAGSREVMLDAMRWADSKGLTYSRVVLLQPTSPLRSVDDIRRTIALYDSHAGNTDMAVTVTEAACNPYYDCFETDDEGCLHVSKGAGDITRRQDAPAAWQFNGAVYVFNPESLRRLPFNKMTHRRPCPMPRERSVDLDTPLDWEVAELIYARLNHQQPE